MAAGGVFIASAYQLLRRGCTYDQLVTAVSTCVLPAGVNLIHIAEGSVILKVQAKDILALDTLWSSYTDGTLRKSLQALFITDEMRELADGEQLEVSVTIEQEEYEKARKELINEAEGELISYMFFLCSFNMRVDANPAITFLKYKVVLII